MTGQARIAMRGLHLPCTIGHYPTGTVAPDLHLLDLILTISSEHVLVAADEMAQVFDYDPLLAQISRIACARHYVTQEYLLTRIVRVCAAYKQITALEAKLRKSPVGGGTVGVELILKSEDLEKLRALNADQAEPDGQGANQ
ncbi:dihydroneopterin aldolase [Roseinatronobacter sp. NSM]|uniref:dihydroneopterin aldolase n=1 Tax=Roseinatronobacter sp. NSM TaxID=3457785 RepID=UPI004036C12D